MPHCFLMPLCRFEGLTASDKTLDFSKKWWYIKIVFLSVCASRLKACRKTFFYFRLHSSLLQLLPEQVKRGPYFCIYKITIVLPVNLFTIEKIIKACYIIRKVMKLQECSLWKKTVLPVLTN